MESLGALMSEGEGRLYNTNKRTFRKIKNK